LYSNKIFLPVLKHVKKSLETAWIKDSVNTCCFFGAVKKEAILLKCLCSKGFENTLAEMLVQQGFQPFCF
jgi:hypothetical protein